MKVKYADFQQVTRRHTVTAPVSSQEELRALSIELVRTLLPPEKPIRLVGVTVANFDKGRVNPLDQLELAFESRIPR